MLQRSILSLPICFIVISAIPMMVYKDVQFNPTDVKNQLIDTLSTMTRNECVCRCYADFSCITGAFIGILQNCTLYSASIQQGQIQMMMNSNATVFSFPMRISNTELDYLPEIIEWLFDGNFNDVYGHYNGTLIDGNVATWISPGYNGYSSTVYLESGNHSLVDRYLNLTMTNFTISAWIWIPSDTQMVNDAYFILFGHCEYTGQDKCLHVGALKQKLYFGFFTDDLLGSTVLNFDQWYHVAFTYNRFIPEQIVHLNGVQDANRTCSYAFTGNASNVTLGAVPQFLGWTTFRTGYIDKITFVPRIKTDDELLEEATLVAYYPFDNTYSDFGPNQIDNTTSVNTVFDSYGRFNQSLSLGSSSYPSYFQTTGFYYLCRSNYSYSFSMWIYPIQIAGTILQVIYSDGTYIPMIGFGSGGRLTIQTLSSNGLYAVSSINIMLLINVWSHIGMTYSTINGIQLYIGGSLVGSNAASTDYIARGKYCTIMVGTNFSLSSSTGSQSQISSSQFQGMIDELKIFSRELSASEISQLASARGISGIELLNGAAEFQTN